MKLKCQPEDFRVEELTAARPAAKGRFVFYRLTKTDLGTIEAVEVICRRWNLAARQVSYAGLKDRHAVTVQFLAIADGPDRSIQTPRFELEPVGRLDRPYTSHLLIGNRFELIIREMDGPEVARASAAIEQMAEAGLPNYFDDQRFGSVGRGGEFVASAWMRGDHGRALWLAMAEPNPSDRAAAKAEKAILRDCWGDWPEAKRQLPRSSARSIVTYLVDHPEDFRGAFTRLRKDLRMLYFSAFQSHLWNLLLARWLEEVCGAEVLVPVRLKLGDFPFPRSIPRDRIDEARRAILTLPSARSPAPDGRLGEAAEAVLSDFGLTWNDLRIKHIKDIFLSKGGRPCLFEAKGLRSEVEDDTLHPGRQALRMSFELPKGSYATILVKRITDAAEPPS